MEKLVWLNLNTGEFSQSWKEEDYSFDTEHFLSKYSPMEGWKLIKYECLNDDDFEFNNMMVIK